MLRHMEDLASQALDKEKTKKVRDAEKKIFDGVNVLKQQCRTVQATIDFLQHRAQLYKDMVSRINRNLHQDFTTYLKMS